MGASLLILVLFNYVFPFPLDHNACSIKKWITCIWIYFWVIMFLLSITLSFLRCHSCLIKMALYANLGISCNKYFLFCIALEFVLLFQTESHWVALALAVETRLVLNIHESFCLSSGITATATLEISCLLPEFCVNLRISLISLTKIPRGVLIRMLTDWQSEFSNNWYLCNSVCSWYLPGYSSLLFTH